MGMRPYWAKVLVRTRVWADTREVHKMGWAAPGVRVRVIEVYRSWRRFSQHTGDSAEIKAMGGGYNEWWIKGDVLEGASTPDPTPVPGPGSVTNEELGAAVRMIVVFLREHLK